jgi:hypothetical protein
MGCHDAVAVLLLSWGRLVGLSQNHQWIGCKGLDAPEVVEEKVTSEVT